MKINKKYVIILWSILIFLISKLLWWSFLISALLSLSLVLLYYLSSINDNKKIFAIIWWLFIVWIDLFLFILLLVPTNSYKIDIKDYYNKKQNYAKLFFKDDEKDKKNLLFIIKNNDRIRKKVDIFKYTKKTKKEKIILKEWDKIYFICKIKNKLTKKCAPYKSFVAIYLWDDSIFRITPWTIIKLNKILKNTNNLADSKTNIQVEKWNLWFHIVRLIKDSNSMKIDTWKWQSLIIRWTAWLVSKDENITYAVDYSHYIEVKNWKKSAILKQWEWAKIEKNNIDIDNMENILNKIWINKNYLKELDNLDKKYLDNSLKQLNKYIKSIDKNNIIWKLEKIKLETFAIWDKKYKKYLENLENYKYLIWENTDFSKQLSENPNLAFLATNLNKVEVKLWFLKNELAKFKNSDTYKTYIINMWIAGKVDDVKWTISKWLENLNQNLEKIMENTDKKIDNIINNFDF